MHSKKITVKNRILCIVLTALLLAVTSVPTVSADNTGFTGTGAFFSSVNKIIDINAVTDFGADNTGMSDAQPQIQKALDYAKDNAKADVICRISIPAGTYKLKSALTISSNTWLYCDANAVLKRYNSNDPILKSAVYGIGGYNDTANIIVEGGTWDGNTSQYQTPQGFSNMRFGHCNNLWLKNLNVINNNGGHHMEIGGAKDILIEGCSFSGYIGDNDKEAIQLDTMNSTEVFEGYEPFDDTSCENVIIRNNSFSGIPRGIGSHSATVGVYYKNILIENNFFDNISGITMIMYNYKNCTIRNNIINGCVSGIELKNMSGNPDNNFHAPAVDPSLVNNVNYYSDSVIENNNIITSYNEKFDYSTGIIISGYKVSNAENVPDGNYEIGGVTVRNNFINTIGAGITLKNARDCDIKSNQIVYNDSRKMFNNKNSVNLNDCTAVKLSDNKINSANNMGIIMTRSKNCQLSGNLILGTKDTGICLKDKCSSDKISGNTIQNSGHHGIAVMDNSNADIIENKIEKSAAVGILGYSRSSCNAKSNTVAQSGTHGIVMENVTKGEVSSNTVKNNVKDGILVYNGAENVSVTSNQLENNGKNGITAAKANKNISLKNNNINGANQYGLSINSNSNAYLSGNGVANTKSSKISVSKDSTISTAKPSGLKVTLTSKTESKISFGKVSSTAGYEIYRKENSGSYKLIKTATSTSITDSKLSAGKTYYYKVRAYESSGERKFYSGYTSEVSVKTSGKLSLKNASVNSIDSQEYTSKAVTPSVTVKCAGKTLKKDTDYTVKYSSNVNVGQAKAVITGKGNYQDSVTVYFNIVPKKQNIKTISSSSNKVSFSWEKRSSANGYAYQISTSNSFKNAKTQKITSNSTSAKTVSGLKKGTVYYVRVRDYKTVSGKNYDGKWSSVKQIKCK